MTFGFLGMIPAWCCCCFGPEKDYQCLDSIILFSSGFNRIFDTDDDGDESTVVATEKEIPVKPGENSRMPSKHCHELSKAQNNSNKRTNHKQHQRNSKIISVFVRNITLLLAISDVNNSKHMNEHNSVIQNLVCK